MKKLCTLLVSELRPYKMLRTKSFRLALGS